MKLLIRPFWADFDFSGRPPVYKTAALPIELCRIHPRACTGQMDGQVARKLDDAGLQDRECHMRGSRAQHLDGLIVEYLEHCGGGIGVVRIELLKAGVTR
jgi:hypothetical protein